MTSSKRKEHSSPLLKVDVFTLYSSIYENSLACIYYADLEGNFLDANQKALDLLGYTKKDIRKLNYASFLSDKDLKRALKTLKELIRTGKQKNVEEYALRRKDGTFVFVNAIASLLYQDGEPIALHGVAIDISKRKSVETALQSSEKKYRAILDKAPDAVLIRNKHGNIVDANIQATKLFGYSKKELIGQHVSKVYTSEDFKRVKKAIERSNRHGQASLEDINVLRKDGQKINVDANGSHFTVGEDVLYKIIFRDMTEQRKMQDQLKKAKVELEAKIVERTMELMEANTALKVLMSHREKEKSENEEKLLTNIQGQVLPYIHDLMKGPLNTRQKDDLRMLDKNLQNIMSEFLTHLQANVSKFTPKEIQVASLIREGLGTKDIAKLLSVSSKTVDIFRYNIRKKLGLNNRSTNLRSHLLSI